MAKIDLTGWWAVDNDMGDESSLYAVVGELPTKDGTTWVLRDEATGVCYVASYLTSYSWFKPEDRALVAAKQQKEIDDYKTAMADDEDDEDDETDEAA